MKKIWYSYDDIHHTLAELVAKIRAAGHPVDAMLAIGGGGFIPARIMRAFLGVPIYTVTVAYYDTNDQPTDSPVKLQWTDGLPENLKHKNILVVDEVDDSRVTLEYCITELRKEGFEHLSVAVLHEKIKEKKGTLPSDLPYFSAIKVAGDYWINYPWESQDIDEHCRQVAAFKASRENS